VGEMWRVVEEEGEQGVRDNRGEAKKWKVLGWRGGGE